MSPDGVTWAESAAYNAASATLSLSVPADTWVLATVSVRREATFSEGWTVLHVTQPVGANTNQRIVFGCIYAETAQTVSLTVTTQGSGRIYMTMMGFSFAGGFAYHPGTETVYTGSGPAVATRPAYPWLVWGCSAPFWRTNSTSDTWVCDELGTVIPDSGSYEKRQGNFLDFLSGSTRTFTTTSPSLSLPNGVVIDCVEVLPKEQGNYNDDSFLEGIAVGMSLVRDMQVSGCVTLQGNGPFTLSLNTVPSSGHYWDGVLEYSVNGSPWEEWDGRTAIQSGADNAIRMRGTGNTRITGIGSGRQWSISGADAVKVRFEGNIENLLDWKTARTGRHPEMGSYCFCRLLFGCTSLVSAPDLPSPAAAEGCYIQMFEGCTSLAEAPALPMTTIAKSCYQAMFYGCTSLTKAPELPATEMEYYCYASMFYGCTSLTEAPTLPATTLAGYCYYEMFRGCSSLAAPPELPATELAECCYQMMFFDCASLETPPMFPVQSLAPQCFRSMFGNCTSLTTAPSLPATILADACYRDMFKGCTSLTTAPALPATELADSCYRGMFTSCSSLTTAPSLPATTLANSCYYAMFHSCSSLTTAPALPAPTLASSCYYAMFEICTSLTTAPELSATILAEHCYSYMFSACSSLTTAPALPATELADYCYYGMLRRCTSLTEAPTLPATTLAGYCYSEMFYECTSISEAPVLPAKTMKRHCYFAMFHKCTGLETPPSLPATTLEDSCYREMFRECTALEKIPFLPATRLVDSCYREMFRDCSLIKISTSQTGDYTNAYRIPSSGDGTAGDSSLKDMFRNTGGTFPYWTPAINTTYYTSNEIVPAE